MPIYRIFVTTALVATIAVAGAPAVQAKRVSDSAETREATRMQPVHR